jgi:hypothetical protein
LASHHFENEFHYLPWSIMREVIIPGVDIPALDFRAPRQPEGSERRPWPPVTSIKNFRILLAESWGEVDDVLARGFISDLSRVPSDRFMIIGIDVEGDPGRENDAMKGANQTNQNGRSKMPPARQRPPPSTLQIANGEMALVIPIWHLLMRERSSAVPSRLRSILMSDQVLFGGVQSEDDLVWLDQWDIVRRRSMFGARVNSALDVAPLVNRWRRQCGLEELTYLVSGAFSDPFGRATGEVENGLSNPSYPDLRVGWKRHRLAVSAWDAPPREWTKEMLVYAGLDAVAGYLVAARLYGLWPDPRSTAVLSPYPRISDATELEHPRYRPRHLRTGFGVEAWSRIVYNEAREYLANTPAGRAHASDVLSHLSREVHLWKLLESQDLMILLQWLLKRVIAGHGLIATESIVTGSNNGPIDSVDADGLHGIWNTSSFEHIFIAFDDTRGIPFEDDPPTPLPPDEPPRSLVDSLSNLPCRYRIPVCPLERLVKEFLFWSPHLLVHPPSVAEKAARRWVCRLVQLRFILPAETIKEGLQTASGIPVALAGDVDRIEWEAVAMFKVILPDAKTLRKRTQGTAFADDPSDAVEAKDPKRLKPMGRLTLLDGRSVALQNVLLGKYAPDTRFKELLSRQRTLPTELARAVRDYLVVRHATQTFSLDRILKDESGLSLAVDIARLFHITTPPPPSTLASALSLVSEYFAHEIPDDIDSMTMARVLCSMNVFPEFGLKADLTANSVSLDPLQAEKWKGRVAPPIPSNAVLERAQRAVLAQVSVLPVQVRALTQRLILVEDKVPFPTHPEDAHRTRFRRLKEKERACMKSMVARAHVYLRAIAQLAHAGHLAATSPTHVARASSIAPRPVPEWTPTVLHRHTARWTIQKILQVHHEVSSTTPYASSDVFRKRLFEALHRLDMVPGTTAGGHALTCFMMDQLARLRLIQWHDAMGTPAPPPAHHKRLRLSAAASLVPSSTLTRVSTTPAAASLDPTMPLPIPETRFPMAHPLLPTLLRTLYTIPYGLGRSRPSAPLQEILNQLYRAGKRAMMGSLCDCALTGLAEYAIWKEIQADRLCIYQASVVTSTLVSEMPLESDGSEEEEEGMITDDMGSHFVSDGGDLTERTSTPGNDVLILSLTSPTASL